MRTSSAMSKNEAELNRFVNLFVRAKIQWVDKCEPQYAINVWSSTLQEE